MDNLCCASCSAPLHPEDGHDMCLPCLGVDHLREALSDHACSNCSVLPRAVRLARLSSVEQPADWAVSVQQDPLPPGHAAASMKRSAADVPLASGRRAEWRGAPGLSTRVDQLSTEMAQMKALLQSLRADGGRGETSHPEQGGSSICDDDAISVAASGTFFREDFPELGSRTSGAWMGRIGNSLSHLMLGLFCSVESVPLDQLTQGLLDASLQAFALMTRELGRTPSMLVHAWRQVWLAQSSLTEPCRRTLRAIPVVPEELFGSAALEALERTAQPVHSLLLVLCFILIFSYLTDYPPCLIFCNAYFFLAFPAQISLHTFHDKGSENGTIVR
ncbi:hypothetical protein GOODEAATRI_031147 [Goodea atripinnis]|uniref:Uncharacterized protein n=1 Tax=Goodea atripinnis TaxID=208336 RepID=A0ABV0P996_9TELE